MDAEQHEILNLVSWQLYHLAQALTRATRLEVLRESFHKEVYDSIICRTSIFDPMAPKGMSPSTDEQAIRIIEIKERYEHKIRMEYNRNVQWMRIIDQASESDKIILIRYFQHKKKVPLGVIMGVLDRVKEQVFEEEREIEFKRNQTALKEFRAIVEKNRKTSKPALKIQFFENGEWILMDLNEHMKHKRERYFGRQHDNLERRMQDLRMDLIYSS